MVKPLPVRNGVAASRLQLPAGSWTTVLDAVCAKFPSIDRAVWCERIVRRDVADSNGIAITSTTPYRVGMEIHYYREVSGEPRIPFDESIVHEDAHLIIVDKPHFLPVVPSGRFVEETLLARLIRRSGNADLAPLHRIDRATAGLVMVSANASSRSAYQQLFRERRIRKVYEALAPALPARTFPMTFTSRLVRGEPFFRMQTVEGLPNSETQVDVIDRAGAVWRYGLEPVSGRKHQLRVHMAALGAPILNDELYPELASSDAHNARADDFSRPLQLLAKRLEFRDPLNGEIRSFDSGLTLRDLRLPNEASPLRHT
ncbi:MAG: pseudouridine synthase [Dokdonella sp.]|uniref:pseudouridine synthase n=1 Tax=Dokdonella sp. TaxID=2291710 RepID=UPI00326422C9